MRRHRSAGVKIRVDQRPERPGALEPRIEVEPELTGEVQVRALTRRDDNAVHRAELADAVGGFADNGLGRSKTDFNEIVESSLRKAGLWDEVKDRLAQPGTGLSGGQQQRLCIARAIAINPEVILMDEPASALDPIATARIEELIDELRQNYTIVIVTHSMQQAARVSQRTSFFHLGKLVEEGETGTIFTNPKDKRTLDYITGRFG